MKVTVEYTVPPKDQYSVRACWIEGDIGGVMEWLEGCDLTVRAVDDA
ncbi:UNVERIFIED_ORG: hypothetical protein M2328_006086 [Rhodococcus erythropolis]